MYWYPLGLEAGKTYYWRVDEEEATGKIFTGDVWSFTAAPVTAWSPSPQWRQVDRSEHRSELAPGSAATRTPCTSGPIRRPWPHVIPASSKGDAVRDGL